MNPVTKLNPWQIKDLQNQEEEIKVRKQKTRYMYVDNKEWRQFWKRLEENGMDAATKMQQNLQIKKGYMLGQYQPTLGIILNVIC